MLATSRRDHGPAHRSTPENARLAGKQGVVRYVLALSLLLVAILFAVAYRVRV
jgi:hypothetical protein